MNRKILSVIGIVVALVLSCGLAFGDSISNLSQIVGRDITQEVCLSMPAGHDFANWEATTLAVLRSMRTGDVTNFVANSTAGMLDREFERTATLLLRAVFFVAVVEGSAVPGEDRDAEVVLDRERADYEDEREPRDVAEVDALDADKRQEEV